MKIQELLDNLLHKKLGRDVRQSIHDSIEQCYKDATGHPESVAGVIEENKNMQKQLDSNINTINGRIDTILTGTVNTTKLVTVHSATIRNNSASDLTFKISSKDNETLKSIKDKSPTVINANVIAKALDGVAINGKGIPSSYNVESTNDEYVITVYSGSSSVVGQYVFMAVVTIAYKDTATDISSAELKDIRTGANGTTYPTAGDAVREQINDLKKELDDSNLDENVSQIQQNMNDISQLKEDLSNNISPNLFNPAVAKANVAISSDDGSEMNGFSGWEATDYISVSKNDVLYFSSNGKPTPYSTGAFYDAQKKFTSGFGNPNNNNNNITVTSDGYARFSFGSKKEKLQIEKGSRTTYIPYGELKVKAEIDNVKEDTGNIKAEVSEVKAEVTKIQEDHTNIFNKDTVVKGAIFADSGYFDSSLTSWETSDYIPVKPGMVLYFSSNKLPIGVASTGVYFDKDKKYLSGINNKPTVLTVPDGAYYLRFSKNGGFGDALNTLKIEQHGITKFTPYGELYVTVNESALPSSILPKWKGLKILTLGDSITAMGGVNGWTYWIKQYLLADKVVNVSVAGSTWQDKVANQTYDGNPKPSTDGNVMGNQVQKVLNAKANGDADYQDFDGIIFSFGTNDSVDFSVQTKESAEKQFITNYAQNNFTVVPIDNVNRQTLAGAMRYGFQKLHEAYPNAVIFMCTPTQECYETFDSIYQKGNLINYIADRLGAETIDTRRCGIRNIYESQTTIDYDHPEQSGVAPIQTDLLDGIHTNENGAKKIAKYNAREIMKYFMVN